MIAYMAKKFAPGGSKFPSTRFYLTPSLHPVHHIRGRVWAKDPIQNFECLDITCSLRPKTYSPYICYLIVDRKDI